MTVVSCNCCMEEWGRRSRFFIPNLSERGSFQYIEGSVTSGSIDNFTFADNELVLVIKLKMNPLLIMRLRIQWNYTALLLAKMLHKS